MKILCTFPGKHGDLLWALPTVRAISETYKQPIDLQIAGAYGSISDLVQRQSYIRTMFVDTGWGIQETAPISPRTPSAVVDGYDQVFHLGYEGWPGPTLPIDIYRRAATQQALVAIDLLRPWIRAPYALPASDLCLGFTDEHFELKYGIYWLLRDRFIHSGTPLHFQLTSISTSPRWRTEARLPGCNWETAASWLATARVFLGCCSALHVLACAVGTPVIVMEPNEARHNAIFYPYGKIGPQVTLVTGSDGQPTFDARHVGDTVYSAIMRREVQDVRSVQ